MGETIEKHVFNTATSSVRESEEWSHKDLEQLWTRNDFSRGLKVSKDSVSLLYISTTVLVNFKTCIEEGGQVDDSFDCVTPDLD